MDKLTESDWLQIEQAAELCQNLVFCGIKSLDARGELVKKGKIRHNGGNARRVK